MLPFFQKFNMSFSLIGEWFILVYLSNLCGVSKGHGSLSFARNTPLLRATAHLSWDLWGKPCGLYFPEVKKEST